MPTNLPVIVHPHFHFRRTGVTRHVELVLEALSQSREAFGTGQSLGPGVPKKGFFATLRTLWGRPAVWHAHRNNEALVGLLLRLFFRGLKVVYTRHASHRASGYTRWLFRRADAAVALTAEMAAGLGTEATVIGHGTDLSRFRPAPNRSEAFAALGLGQGLGLGLVGRIRPEKGQGDFVDAWTRLDARTREAWRVVFVGHAKATEKGFADGLQAALPSLQLPGEQRDVLPWYQGLTVLVHPSWTEGYSMVLLEAMAAGCCVVASALPYAKEMVDSGRTGFLFPPHDVEALREILASLAADPAKAEAVGRAAADEARRRFGVDREAEALAALYDAVARR